MYISQVGEEVENMAQNHVEKVHYWIILIELEQSGLEDQYHKSEQLQCNVN